MASIYYEKDADASALNGKRIAVLGYGSQGHAHALNLKESGADVVVGLYEGSRSWEKAEKDGLKVKNVGDACKSADIIMMLIPDTKQAEVYRVAVAPNLVAGNMLMFAHGFNLHYHQIQPPESVDVTMIAPKAPGHRVREVYQEGLGVPALLAVYQNTTGKAKELALAYAHGIGSTRAGVIETTIKEETETDLFGEQTILCGGVSSLIKAAFETLVEAGYQPEIAYFECLHELKLIVDLIYEGGLAYMRYSVSDTAEYGDYTRGPRMVDSRTKAEMRKVLDEIQMGTFARDWILENQANRPSFLAQRKAESDHQIEHVGRKLREMMPWIRRK